MNEDENNNPIDRWFTNLAEPQPPALTAELLGQTIAQVRGQTINHLWTDEYPATPIFQLAQQIEQQAHRNWHSYFAPLGQQPGAPERTTEKEKIMHVLINDENGNVYRAELEKVNMDAFSSALKDLGLSGQNKITVVKKEVTGATGDLYISDDATFAVKRQDFLNINTRWTPWKNVVNDVTTVFFEPTFDVGQIEQKVVVDLALNPLYLIYEKKYSDENFYAIFVEKHGNKIDTFYLALPNVFGDGHICLGDYNKIKGKSIFERFESAVKIFNDSTFGNKDLWAQEEKKKALVSSWFIDPDFKFINNPYQGKIKFVDEQISSIVTEILKNEAKQ